MIIYSSWIKQTDIILNKDIGIVIWIDKLKNIHISLYIQNTHLMIYLKYLVEKIIHDRIRF